MLSILPGNSIRDLGNGQWAILDGQTLRRATYDGTVWTLHEMMGAEANSPPDPFGDAVRSAQEPRPEPPPTYEPDRFTDPGFDHDAA